MRARALVLALVGAILAGVAAGAEEADTIDVAPVRDKLKMFGDGAGHYLVLLPEADRHGEWLFYGDGKTFHQLRGGTAPNGTELSGSFRDARLDEGSNGWGYLASEAGGWVVACESRKTPFNPVAEADAKQALAKATFLPPGFDRVSHVLARDADLRYYFVDRKYEDSMDARKSGFRMWIGKRGGMAAQKMTDWVSDSAGDVFATKNGQLRLDHDKKVAVWASGGKEITLTWVPADDNRVMIHKELGVYSGLRYGTPCDDL
jgi:nitrous oxide reductase accessory protein NosL